MEVLEEVPKDEWMFWEQHWIQVIRGWGFNLTNGDSGGLGRDRYTQELKDKISNKLIGRKNLALSKKVFSYLPNGEFFKEHISACDAAREIKGAQANIWRAIKSNTMAYGFLWKYDRVDKAIRKIRPKMSQESKEKIRVANVGKFVSLETRHKQSLAKLGKVPWNKGIIQIKGAR
jgi:hypothetical protein